LGDRKGKGKGKKEGEGKEREGLKIWRALIFTSFSTG